MNSQESDNYNTDIMIQYFVKLEQLNNHLLHLKYLFENAELWALSMSQG